METKISDKIKMKQKAARGIARRHGNGIPEKDNYNHCCDPDYHNGEECDGSC